MLRPYNKPTDSLKQQNATAIPATEQQSKLDRRPSQTVYAGQNKSIGAHSNQIELLELLDKCTCKKDKITISTHHHQRGRDINMLTNKDYLEAMCQSYFVISQEIMKDDRLLIRAWMKDSKNNNDENTNEAEQILLKHKKTKNLPSLTLELRRFVVRIKQQRQNINNDQSCSSLFSQTQSRGCSSTRYLSDNKLPGKKEQNGQKYNQQRQQQQQESQEGQEFLRLNEENNNQQRFPLKQLECNTNSNNSSWQQQLQQNQLSQQQQQLFAYQQQLLKNQIPAHFTQQQVQHLLKVRYEQQENQNKADLSEKKAELRFQEDNQEGEIFQQYPDQNSLFCGQQQQLEEQQQEYYQREQLSERIQEAERGGNDFDEHRDDNNQLDCREEQQQEEAYYRQRSEQQQQKYGNDNEDDEEQLAEINNQDSNINQVVILRTDANNQGQQINSKRNDNTNEQDEYKEDSMRNIYHNINGDNRYYNNQQLEEDHIEQGQQGEQLEQQNHSHQYHHRQEDQQELKQNQQDIEYNRTGLLEYENDKDDDINIDTLRLGEQQALRREDQQASLYYQQQQEQQYDQQQWQTFQQKEQQQQQQQAQLILPVFDEQGGSCEGNTTNTTTTTGTVPKIISKPIIQSNNNNNNYINQDSDENYCSIGADSEREHQELSAIHHEYYPNQYNQQQSNQGFNSNNTSNSNIKLIQTLSRSSSSLSCFDNNHINSASNNPSLKSIPNHFITNGISSNLSNRFLANGIQCKFTKSISSHQPQQSQIQSSELFTNAFNIPDGQSQQTNENNNNNNITAQNDTLKKNQLIENQPNDYSQQISLLQRKTVPSLVTNMFATSASQKQFVVDTKYANLPSNSQSQSNISNNSIYCNTKMPAEIASQFVNRMANSSTDLKLRYKDLFTSPELMLKCQVNPVESFQSSQYFERPRTLSGSSVFFQDSSKQFNNTKSTLFRKPFQQQDNSVNQSSASINSLMSQSLRQPQFMISAKLAVTVLESGVQLVERFRLFNVTAQDFFESIFKTDIHVDRMKFHDRIILLYPELNQTDFDAFFDYLDVSEENILSVNSTGAALMQICNYKSPESGRLIKAFNFLDTEKKGFVTKLEVETLLHPRIVSQNYHNSAVNLAAKIFAEADWEQKGFITYWEIFSRKHSEPVKQLVEIITA